MTKIEFFVPGKSETAGSKIGYIIKSKKNGKQFVNQVDSNHIGIKKYRPLVQHYALKAMNNKALLTGPLKLTAHFMMVRPKSHYTSKGALRKGAPAYPGGTRDTTKLLRALEDALNKIVWKDDSQVVWQFATKSFRIREGVYVKIETFTKQEIMKWV